MNCDHCHAPIKNPHKGQRFCPGGKCRAAWHRSNKLPGTVKGVRQNKRGWSVTIQFNTQPTVTIGQAVAVKTTPETGVRTRSERAQGENGVS